MQFGEYITVNYDENVAKLGIEQVATMSNQDRITIDLKGLRSRIENYKNTPDWRQLSFAGKIRALIELGLNQGEFSAEDSTIAGLLSKHWDSVISSVMQSTLDISTKRLQELKAGKRPNDAELVELSEVLPVDTHQLVEIRDRTFGKNGNGEKKHGEPVKRV